jgi:hypothetical protein
LNEKKTKEKKILNRCGKKAVTANIQLGRRYLPGRTDKNYDNFSQDNLVIGQDLNHPSTKYKSEMMSLGPTCSPSFKDKQISPAHFILTSLLYEIPPTHKDPWKSESKQIFSRKILKT